MADHFVRLALLDVAHGDLRVKHPQTLLPYSEYLRMARAGMFGPDGEDMPLANAAWLVPLDEAEQWFKSKGFPTDLDGLKTELVKMAAHSESAEDIKLPVIPPCVDAAAQTPDGSKPPTNEQN
jgi:hypothetical protein